MKIRYEPTPDGDLRKYVNGRLVDRLNVSLDRKTALLFASAPRLREKNAKLRADLASSRAENEKLRLLGGAELGRLDVMWQRLVVERDAARAENEKLKRQVMEWRGAATKIREILDYMSKEGE